VEKRCECAERLSPGDGIVSPTQNLKESILQAANSEAGEKKPGLRESRAARDADNAALASGRHFPQQVPTPRSRVRSRRLFAPPLTALRICRSDTALHTQTIMAAIVNANANDCQYRMDVHLNRHLNFISYVESRLDVLK
jgi:hypothetical protein